MTAAADSRAAGGWLSAGAIAIIPAVGQNSDGGQNPLTATWRTEHGCYPCAGRRQSDPTPEVGQGPASIVALVSPLGAAGWLYAAAESCRADGSWGLPTQAHIVQNRTAARSVQLLGGGSYGWGAGGSTTGSVARPKVCPMPPHVKGDDVWGKIPQPRP